MYIGCWDFGIIDFYLQCEEVENLICEMKIINMFVKSVLVMLLGDYLLMVGVNFEKEELFDDIFNWIFDCIEVDIFKWVLFVEDEWMLLGNVLIIVGLCLDDDENFGSYVSLCFYGVWGMVLCWILKGGVFIGFCLLVLCELIVDWGQVSCGGNIYGNLDLEFEILVNKELGLYFNVGCDLQVNVIVFYNDFKDKIICVVCLISICIDGFNQFGFDFIYWVNVDEVVIQGVEVVVFIMLVCILDLIFSYIYMDFE